MFVLASTLVIGILTLLRWIVYTFQVRKFKRNDDWTFTKIEEQQKPLKENDVTEEEAIELQETPSPVHYESLAIPDNQGKLEYIGVVAIFRPFLLHNFFEDYIHISLSKKG